MVRYPFGWSDNYAVCESFSLWGSTVVVVSSMPGLHGPGLRGLPGLMGAHRLHSTLTPTILPRRTYLLNGQAIICGSLAIQGCSRRDRVLTASAGSTRFNDMLGSVYVVLSLYRGVPRGAGS